MFLHYASLVRKDFKLFNQIIAGLGNFLDVRMFVMSVD